MKIKLIIFDFDGTLGDTRANIIMTMQETMRVLGYPVAGEEAIAATIGLTLEDGFRELFPGLTERDILRCADVYRDLFEKNRRKMIPTLFPHVKETLNLLKERGYILSVASSRQSVSLRGFLHDMSVEDCISYILGADNVEKSKPDPEPVLKTLRELGIPAEESLVVGDMPVDIIMGLRAGAATCGVTYGNSSRDDLVEAGAGYIIEDISELPGLL
ncbi:MAG: HAD family hydrolase [Bacteroidales bacterium]|jgi:phosphoglycolate phosphatase|nr:HAD family hydrolase [Bacteroidales bacterium]MBQ2198222.1 HAD family hydrolase [Bacteroidales bacterium]MBR5396256.1 HAD family hydrolase [Bacteroidales bacterium]